MQLSSLTQPIHFALISEIPSVGIGEVGTVARAIQHQLTNDLGPVWDIENATIDAYESTGTMPDGAWPVILGDDRRFTFPSLGLHFTNDGTPFALIKHTQEWSVAASHEVLEMCTDPTGDRIMVSQSITSSDGLVEYLLEVCDPCEATSYAYEIDGTRVSDFYTPNYFDAESQPGVAYSRCANIKQPRQVLPGGYLSWWDSYTDRHWQMRLFETEQGIFPVEDFDSEELESRRTEIDRLTPSPLLGGRVVPAASNGYAPPGPDDKFSERIEELRRAAARPRP